MAFTTTATTHHYLHSNVKLRVPTALTVKPHPDHTWSITFNKQAGKGFDLGLTHTLISHEKPSPVKFSHDGKYVAVGCSGGEAHIFEVETGTLTRSVVNCQNKCVFDDDDYCSILRNVLSREEEPIEAASFSRDGKYLATGSSEGDINVISNLFFLNHPDCVHAHLLQIWEIKTKHVRNTFQDHTHEILSLNFSPDDRLLVSTAGDNTVRLWDMRNGATTFLTDDEEEYHKDNDDDNMFLDYPRHTSVVFSPDGRFLATSHRDGMLRIWGVRSGRLLRRIKAHRDCVYDVAFMPNGKGLVSASQDRTLKYWDISSLYNSQARLEVQTQPERVFLGHEVRFILLFVIFFPLTFRTGSCPLPRHLSRWEMDRLRLGR